MQQNNCVIRPMNPWVIHLQKLGLELKCSLCLSFLKMPYLLPCDHIFCNSCLAETKDSTSECPLCNVQYLGRDLRFLPFIENIVTIYRSLDAALYSNFSKSSCSDTGKILEQSSADCNDKLSKESLKVAQEDDLSSGRSLLLTGNRLAQLPLNFSCEDKAQNAYMSDKCDVPRELKDHEMNAGNAEQNVNFTQLTSEVSSGRLQECGTSPMNINLADQLSAGSPPSFGDGKSPENDSCDQGDDSLTNCQVARIVKRISGHDDFASGTEGGTLKDSKRPKKLDCGPSNLSMRMICTTSSPAEILGTCYSQAEHKLVPHTDGQAPAVLEHSSATATICGFCQSSRIADDMGPMLHYVNEKLVEGDEASASIALHVHSICIEWAPQVYYDDNGLVKNLKAELARGSKLKCSKCGLKGAALGCYLKSCRRSYHVTCAMEIAGCRWDHDNYLVLCPSHTSVKFPDEKKFKSRKHRLEHCHGQPQVAPQQPNVWTKSFTRAKDWVISGSALSSEDKYLLVEFGSMIGARVTKFWNSDVTHVIAATDSKGACTRTLKVLMAILNGRWVLTIDWVRACMKSKRPVNEEPYEVCVDSHGCHGGPRAGRLSACSKVPKLFSGMNFYFAGEFVLVQKEDLQNLVVAAGGTILEDKDTTVEQSHDEATPSKTLVVYDLDSLQGCKSGEEAMIVRQRLNEAEDLVAKTGFQVINHKWLFESIASYKLQSFVSFHGIHNDSN